MNNLTPFIESNLFLLCQEEELIEEAKKIVQEMSHQEFRGLRRYAWKFSDFIAEEHRRRNMNKDYWENR